MRALFKLIIYIEILYSCIRNVIKVRSFLKSFFRVRWSLWKESQQSAYTEKNLTVNSVDPLAVSCTLII